MISMCQKLSAWPSNNQKKIIKGAFKMNPVELFNQVKELIEKKDFDAAKKFVEEHKDELGEYLDKAKDLVANSKGLNDVINKVKSVF